MKHFLFCLGLLLKNEHSTSSALFWLEAVMKYTFRYLWVVPLFWLCKILNCIWFVVSKVVIIQYMFYLMILVFQLSKIYYIQCTFLQRSYKFYFMHYLSMVIILFNTDWCKCTIPSHSFKKSSFSPVLYFSSVLFFLL